MTADNHARALEVLTLCVREWNALKKHDLVAVSFPALTALYAAAVELKAAEAAKRRAMDEEVYSVVIHERVVAARKGFDAALAVVPKAVLT